MKPKIINISQKDQIVIPVFVRKDLGLEKGTKLSLEVNRDQISLKKIPNSLDWSNLLKQVSVERVEFDKDGHYDAPKHPDFHDWMVNG
ncbi:AbrB/MazE/SpoVT family DNA-binding domain-containing protein [Fructilactobacillus ixorae]|uniref:AbrB/MazE/SpoVT family DNA-binding domain-containing protein n=1 Tax=Fructilactobacillus ixorae TaxID=1750535 RepID=A0ABY5C2F9_9LACO|nr:AbrB/MazE/SpoVT family DNA-binding domain-containing protein [Fructilactobacillus ixorae]USS92962.1 AbrB/MazE/SpoVT family DNA-binding domain-containing protein [Fructilactobacillus ixorae]